MLTTFDLGRLGIGESAGGRLKRPETEYTEPSQRKEAYRRLTELEESQADELERFVKTGIPLRMEYVLLLADSVDTLRVTHGNYFDGPDVTDEEIAELRRRKRTSRPAGTVAG
ncbi:MAG: hypothetical protein J4G13_02305 [Dehalococcoidia bacterium]|nr:hypothetical protein [Dehalococcoidia bacterium]